MRVLIIGATGQLGNDLVREYSDWDVSRAARKNADFVIDLSAPERMRRAILDEIRPELVINTAAAHNVADCEDNPAEAFGVNAVGVGALAKICHEIEARLVHVSTDYVFGNGGKRPWREDDLPAPLNIYGTSKLAGEHLLAAACPDHLIIRSSGLYGIAPCLAKGGKNFVQRMIDLAATRGEVKVVTDEILTPTHTVALARQIRRVAEGGEPGIYHATCQGQCSWNEFAGAIFEETGTDVRLLPATSDDFPSPIRRPGYSVLENARLSEQGLDIMPSWRDGLCSYLDQLRESGALG